MSFDQISSLHFAVRPKVISKYFGQLLLVYAVLLTVPLIFAVLSGEAGPAAAYASITVIVGVAGFLLQRFEVSGDVQHNEVLVISALIFLFVSLCSAIPFYSSGFSPIDAFFESVSGITTTGLSCLPSVESLSRTDLFFRGWLQWNGGLGIVVLSVGLLMPHGKATLHLFKDNWEKDGLVANTKSYARIILAVYLIMTAGGFILLLALGEDWFDALIHTLASVSTGGFSNYDASLAGLADKRSVQSAVLLLSCLGAVPLILYYTVFSGGWRKVVGSPELKGFALAVIIAVAATLASFAFIDGLPIGRAIADGSFMALSAQTTTGFSTVPVDSLSPSSRFLLILFMFVGGNIGSTAGGIKIFRLLVLLKLIQLLVVSSGLPSSAVYQTRLMGRPLDQEEIERCFLLVFLFVLVVVLSLLPFLIMGYPFLDSLFEVVSALCTVGLSAGISSSALPSLLKTVLCADMLMGRLEIVAFLIFVYPSTWFGKRRGA